MNKIMTSIVASNKLLLSFAKVGRISFSEEGEDIVVRNFFDKSYKGFYVDIGDFDKMYSNTYYFYKKDWKGLNIYCKPKDDINTLLRPKDININQDIETISLTNVFKSQLPPRNGFLSDCIDIDILNIDSPGKELKIILSNNWKIFRPRIVLVTDSDKNNVGIINTDSLVYQNLWANNYILVAKTSRTLIFRERNFNKKVLTMNNVTMQRALAT
jgi:hypothetical protein